MSLSLKLGTRGSPLALAQASMTRDALMTAHPDLAVEIVTIKTTGDVVQDRPLAEIGGKALWTKELDRALMDGAIDCAVHSMKDVETIRPEGIAVAAMLPRADVRDRLIGAESIAALRPGAVIGTSSPRRAAQLKRLRPDLETVTLRGNVDTRLARVADGTVDATLLAAAGLDRLGQTAGVAIPVETLLPAPSQGAVGIECLAARGDVLKRLAAINHANTTLRVRAERLLLAHLGADCHSPVAALATIEDGKIRLRAEILSPDGSEHVAGETAGDADAITALADDLLARATPWLRALFRL